MVKLHWEKDIGFIDGYGYRSQSIKLGERAKNKILDNSNDGRVHVGRGMFYISYDPRNEFWYLTFINTGRNTDKSVWVSLLPKGGNKKSKDGFRSLAAAKATAQRMVE